MRARTGMGAGATIASCAVAALAVAGCSSSGSGASATATGASGLPSWAAGLGAGVTLEPPTGAPAAGSPQATVKSYVTALTSGANPASACAYIIPSSQSSCQSSISQAAQKGEDITYSYKSFGIGYTAIDGTQALVGSTYTHFCVQVSSLSCAPDISDPQTVFSSGESFSTLWTQTQQATNATGSFSPVPCVVINGTWYVDAPS